MQRSITPFAAVLLLFAAYCSIRISYADFLFHKNTLATVERAVQLDPSNARYHAWLAELLENEGRDPTPALDAAVRFNPLDSRVWIRRGLMAETAGDTANAERLLLHAAAIDRLMEPRWTLMNFYFRAGDNAKFWPWAKQTLAIGYGDRTPVFDLCWKMRPDAASVAEILPADYTVQFQFFQFLLDCGSLADAASLALRLIPRAAPADTRAYAQCADRLLRTGEAARAREIWNALCDRRLLPFHSGETLTNAAFEHEPTGLAFDWRLPPSPDVAILRRPPAIRFTFSGRQPEQCVPLAQTVALEPRRSYRFSFEYRTAGVAPGSGLRLRALDGVSPDLAADSWTLETIGFTAAAPVGEIALEYRRPLGLPRVEGTLEIRKLTLDRR